MTSQYLPLLKIEALVPANYKYVIKLLNTSGFRKYNKPEKHQYADHGFGQLHDVCIYPDGTYRVGKIILDRNEVFCCNFMDMGWRQLIVGIERMMKVNNTKHKTPIDVNETDEDSDDEWGIRDSNIGDSVIF